MLHLYAITDRPRRRLPSIPGLEGKPLERAAHGRIAGVYTTHSSPAEICEDALWRHEHVVEGLMTDRTALPARFGTAFSDENELRRALRERHAELEQTLDYVRGRVELGVRVLWTRCGTGHAREGRDAASSGRDYLRARLDDHVRSRSLAQAVHEPLADAAVASRYGVSSAPRLVLTAAYLVEREKLRVFEERVAELETMHPEIRILSTGPWPPYNFVDGFRRAP